MRCATAGAPAGDDDGHKIGDHILAFGRGLQSRERHLVLRNELLRIEQIGVERGGVPNDLGGLHRGRIIVIRRFTRLLADDARETRAERVLAGLQRMAGLTFSVDLTTCCRIAIDRCRIRGPWRCLGCGLCRRRGSRHDVIVGRSDCCVCSRGRAARRLCCRRSELSLRAELGAAEAAGAGGRDQLGQLGHSGLCCNRRGALRCDFRLWRLSARCNRCLGRRSGGRRRARGQIQPCQNGADRDYHDVPVAKFRNHRCWHRTPLRLRPIGNGLKVRSSQSLLRRLPGALN